MLTLVGTGGGDLGLTAQPPVWDEPGGSGAGCQPEGRLPVGRRRADLLQDRSLSLLGLDYEEVISCHLGIRNSHFLSTCCVPVTGVDGMENLVEIRGLPPDTRKDRCVTWLCLSWKKPALQDQKAL